MKQNIRLHHKNNESSIIIENIDDVKSYISFLKFKKYHDANEHFQRDSKTYKFCEKEENSKFINIKSYSEETNHVEFLLNICVNCHRNFSKEIINVIQFFFTSCIKSTNDSDIVKE